MQLDAYLYNTIWISQKDVPVSESEAIIKINATNLDSLF